MDKTCLLIVFLNIQKFYLVSKQSQLTPHSISWAQPKKYLCLNYNFKYTELNCRAHITLQRSYNFEKAARHLVVLAAP